MESRVNCLLALILTSTLFSSCAPLPSPEIPNPSSSESSDSQDIFDSSSDLPWLEIAEAVQSEDVFTVTKQDGSSNEENVEVTFAGRIVVEAPCLAEAELMRFDNAHVVLRVPEPVVRREIETENEAHRNPPPLYFFWTSKYDNLKKEALKKAQLDLTTRADAALALTKEKIRESVASILRAQGLDQDVDIQFEKEFVRLKEFERRVRRISPEEISLNNCNGNSEMERKITRSHEVTRSVTASVSKELGIEVKLLTARIAASYQIADGEKVIKAEDLILKTDPRTNVVYSIYWEESEPRGVLVVCKDGERSEFEYSVTRDVTLVTEGARDVGCGD